MAVHIFLVVSSVLQLCYGQQPQLLMQYLNPSQAASLSSQPVQGQGAGLGSLGGPAASFGQILLNLLNYKLQWINNLAGQLTGAPVSPARPGPLHGVGHPPGYPFMTTLVTTLSGNSPTVPGITISGSPVNHVAAPGSYPGAPTAVPAQDFHWTPVLSPGPQSPPTSPGFPGVPVTAGGQTFPVTVSGPVYPGGPVSPIFAGGPGSSGIWVPQGPPAAVQVAPQPVFEQHPPNQPQPPATPVQPAQAAVPVLPAVEDFLPVSGLTPATPAPATTTTTTTTTTPSPKNLP